MNKIPRIVIAGTNSGCGKTTITCALLKAYIRRGLVCCAFKCGPDYIDPMFHSEVTRARSSNLDPFFFDDETLKYLLWNNSQDCDLSVIEGVMGFYDGMGFDSTKASCFDVSNITESPVILAVNAKGMSHSVLAMIEGFCSLHKPNNICGVILNRCSKSAFEGLKDLIEDHFKGKIKVFGYLPDMPNAEIKSRYLGLVTAAEIDDLEIKLLELSDAAEECMDLDALLETAKKAKALKIDQSRSFTKIKEKEGFKDRCTRIAVARDKAFCFYYQDSLKALVELGAELVSFSPVSDGKLPDDTDGLYIGGGYPELYLKEISGNESLRQAVKDAIESGMPCIAECGGFMYLTEEIDGFPMVGAIRGKSVNKKRLTRFGYVTLTADHDNMLCKKGEVVPAHEFHHYDSEFIGDDCTAEKRSGKNYKIGVGGETLCAGYPHMHFYSHPSLAVNFVKACMKYRGLKK